jgi:hypothetical protein
MSWLEQFMEVWRPCNLTPIHSLTDPEGQQFASLGMHKLTLDIGVPEVIRSLALPPFSGCFTRPYADNVKSQQLH